MDLHSVYLLVIIPMNLPWDLLSWRRVVMPEHISSAIIHLVSFTNAQLLPIPLSIYLSSLDNHINQAPRAAKRPSPPTSTIRARLSNVSAPASTVTLLVGVFPLNFHCHCEKKNCRVLRNEASTLQNARTRGSGKDGIHVMLCRVSD